MKITKYMLRPGLHLPLAIALAVMLLAIPVAAQDGENGAEPASKVVIGAQGSSVDAQDDRRGGFDKYRDTPNGFVLDYLKYATTFDGSEFFFDLEATDAMQDDSQYLVRAGYGDAWRLRYSYDATPYIFGSGARTVLGRESLRIGDLVQISMEDPDRNGVPFYSEPAGPGGDNALVQDMTRSLLTGTSPFDVGTKRRAGDIDLRWRASPKFGIGMNYRQDDKRGLQPYGNGSYQRITDVNGDGKTNYDYFFSIRGVELPAPIDYSTTQTGLSANYRSGNWFADAQFVNSDFKNENALLYYDNPFWFTDTEGSSGSRRGLWEQRQVSSAPSNDAWNLKLTGGIAFAGRSNLTVTVASGEHNQNEQFAPIAINKALIGTKDLNHDGVIDGRDDPGSTSILPRSSLQGSVDTQVLAVNFSSRPTDRLRVKAFFKNYEYKENGTSLLIPARAEYNNSRLKTDEKGADLLHIPYFFERQTFGVEGLFDLTDAFRLGASFDRSARNYNKYRDLDPGSSFTRDVGNRSVSGTDDDTLSLKLLWKGTEKVSGWLQWVSSERTMDGAHQVAFQGQNEDLRQFDIANRDRDGFELQLDFFPWEAGSVGVSIRDYEDDYVDSAYGLQNTTETGASVTVAFSAGENTTVHFYGDLAQYESDMHLRTKCANCTPPAGATWTTPWDVPNFDWFPNYADDSVAFGGGVEHRSPDGVNKLALDFNYLDAQIQQSNRNPGTPRDFSQPGAPIAGVALAYSFPDQTSTLSEINLRYTRKLSGLVSVGFAYLFEDWALDDFQVENLSPYGADFLAVDDATRYMVLDSWYGDYTASIGQVFLVMHFE